MRGRPVAPPEETLAMSDRYQSLIQSPVGQLLAKNLGLPNPVELERYNAGDPLVTGTVVVGGEGRLRTTLATTLDSLEIASVEETQDGEKYKGLVFDATGLTTTEQLVELQHFFTPKLRSLDRVRPHHRPRHPAGAGRERRRADRPARARGLHPLPGQGGRSRHHRPARLRRRGRRGGHRLHAGLPAVGQVGLRLRPGRAHRRGRREEARRDRRLGPSARRQDRPRHRRQPRHRRADRPRAAP